MLGTATIQRVVSTICRLVHMTRRSDSFSAGTRPKADAWSMDIWQMEQELNHYRHDYEEANNALHEAWWTVEWKYQSTHTYALRTGNFFRGCSISQRFTLDKGRLIVGRAAEKASVTRIYGPFGMWR